MDKWTVMVVPHGQGAIRSVNLYGFQIWVLVALVAGLSFSSAFFYKRYDKVQTQAERLQHLNRELELTKAPPVEIAGGITPEERTKIEREVRAEYEVRDAAITAELNALYEMEAQLRDKYELPPRVSAITGVETSSRGGGKGGGPSVYDGPLTRRAKNAMKRPPHLIYGLSRPSADLIVQEIRLRTESLSELLGAMAVKREVIDRTPSMWPSLHPLRRLSSGFGYRRDPFNNGVRHHDGTDISAPVGSAVVATAAGKVIYAGWDGDFGNIVRIDHGDNVETWYAHMSKCSVTVGQQVARGDTLGTVGSTGLSTGPHIHYEVRIKGRPVDSGAYLGN